MLQALESMEHKVMQSQVAAYLAVSIAPSLTKPAVTKPIMSSLPTALNLGPNPRRRESFSNSYKPYETASGSRDGRPEASNVVVAEEAEAVFEEDDDTPPAAPRTFVRGNRSFSASYPNAAAAQKAGMRPVPIPEKSGDTPHIANTAKSPQEGGWWFGSIKEF